MKPVNINIKMAKGSTTVLGEMEANVIFNGISIVQKIVVLENLMKSCILGM